MNKLTDGQALAVEIQGMSAAAKFTLYCEMVRIMALATNEELDSQLREDLHAESACIIHLLRTSWKAI